MSNYPYLHIGHAFELSGKNRTIFRLLEIFPELAAWATLIGMVLGSWFWPFGAAIFIILFDTYWLLKTLYLSLHLEYDF